MILLPYLLFFFYVHNVSFVRLPCPPLAKRGSLTHSQALALSKRARDVTALRCSEPLRYRVGGPIKGLAILCGMGPPGNNDTICLSLMLIYISLRKFQRSTSSSMVKMNFLALIFSIIWIWRLSQSRYSFTSSSYLPHHLINLSRLLEE